MSEVICPNCQSVTPHWRNCLVCDAYLEEPAGQSRNVETASLMKSSAGTADRPSDEASQDVQMDAHLRRACARRELGIRKLATSSTYEDELAVIADVTNLAAFKAMAGVRVVSTIAPTADDPGTTLVTARVAADTRMIESLRRQSFVAGLKGSRRIRTALDLTRKEVFPRLELFSSGSVNPGTGVIVGIVDFGLDFVHRAFRLSDRKSSSRILAIWDQKSSTSDAGSPGPFGYGRLFLKKDIDRALDADDPYSALGYEPRLNSTDDTGAHGTYVADVAAGGGSGSTCLGLAPEADIVFVDLSTAGVPMGTPQAVGSAFGDSVQLLEAIKFIFDFAGERPCVVNLSLGTNSGPHDGSTPVERAIDRLVSERQNRAVVIAAGNDGGALIHAEGRVSNGQMLDLGWKIPPFDPTGNELELWYSHDDRFSVQVIDPKGNAVARVKPGKTWTGRLGDNGLLTVVNRLDDPGNHDNTINVFFERGLPSGVWTLRLHGDHVEDGRFQAWIERDEACQSRFVQLDGQSYRVNNKHTLSSISSARGAIVVGSYNGHDPQRSISEFSSQGPTRDKRNVPDVIAPGESVFAAESKTVVLRHRVSGTSVAAATVTGLVASLLAEARASRISLSAEQIKEILTRTAQQDPANGEGWNPRFGFGRVNGTAALAAVRQFAQQAGSPLLQPKARMPRSSMAARSVGSKETTDSLV